MGQTLDNRPWTRPHNLDPLTANLPWNTDYTLDPGLVLTMSLPQAYPGILIIPLTLGPSSPCPGRPCRRAGAAGAGRRRAREVQARNTGG